MVRIKKPKGHIARSKMNEIMPNFYCSNDNKLNDITFELLNDTVMLFIPDDNKVYWPDTVLMILHKKENIEFSQQEDYYMYKEKQSTRNRGAARFHDCCL